MRRITGGTIAALIALATGSLVTVWGGVPGWGLLDGGPVPLDSRVFSGLLAGGAAFFMALLGFSNRAEFSSRGYERCPVCGELKRLGELHLACRGRTFDALGYTFQHD